MSHSPEQRFYFEEMYRTYYPMVLQMGLGYMKGDQQLAMDITQEVFINAWNALPKFRQDSSPKTWIYRITVNTCLLHIRDNKKRTTAELVEEYHGLKPDELVAGNAAAIANDQHAGLYRAIGQLAEIDRLIIMLVLEEIDYDEISRITGINAINLRVKIHRIKKKMKELLKTEFDNE